MDFDGVDVCRIIQNTLCYARFWIIFFHHLFRVMCFIVIQKGAVKNVCIFFHHKNMKMNKKAILPSPYACTLTERAEWRRFFITVQHKHVYNEFSTLSFFSRDHEINFKELLALRFDGKKIISPFFNFLFACVYERRHGDSFIYYYFVEELKTSPRHDNFFFFHIDGGKRKYEEWSNGI